MIRPHSHLRDYQKYIQTHVVEAWKSHKSIMLQMPTGTGKTHLLASIIYDSLKENGCLLYTSPSPRDVYL